MIKKLEFYYTEDGEQINIEDEKIYWDTIKNQFRHKFNCCECGKPLECMCYVSLTSALSGVDDGLVCPDCGESDALNEMSIDDLLYDIGDERRSQINIFVDSLISEEMKIEFISETGGEKLEWSDKMEIIEEGDEEDALKDFIISLLTKEEKWDMWVNTCDGYPEGEACNL